MLSSTNSFEMAGYDDHRTMILFKIDFPSRSTLLGLAMKLDCEQISYIGSHSCKESFTVSGKGNQTNWSQ
jgi:hypothetical protein